MLPALASVLRPFRAAFQPGSHPRSAGLIALAVAVGRGVGKHGAARAGARIAKSPPLVERYLGLALLPAAGVALGLGLVAQKALPDSGSLLYNAVLVAVIANALIGPPLTALAFRRAGEAMRAAGGE